MASPNPNPGDNRGRRLSSFGTQFRERSVKHTRLDDENQFERYYNVGRTLGQGSFGIVKEAVQLDSGLRWAVKIINKERAGSSAMHLLEREVLILKRVDHPNIIKLEEVFETSKKIFLVMELCDRGELKQVVLEKGRLTEDETRTVMKKLSLAVAYMHDHDMVHRDLKLENILLSSHNDDDLNIKLTDFGLSYVKGGTGLDVAMMQSKCGTPLYMAPEVLENHDYSQQCDVWSMGVIMYILLSGPSRQAADDTRLYEQIRQGKLDFPNAKWKEMSSAAKLLIGDMLKVNPADRLSAKEILDHPWIAGCDEASHKRRTVIDLMKEFRQEEEEQAETGSDDVVNGTSVQHQETSKADEKSDRVSNMDGLRPSSKTSRPRPKSATHQANTCSSKSPGSPKPRMRSTSDLQTLVSSGSRSSPAPGTGNTAGSKPLPGYMQPTKSRSTAVEATKQRRERDHTHKS